MPVSTAPPSTTTTYAVYGPGQYHTPSYTAPEAPQNLATDTAQSNLAASPYDQSLADLINATDQAAQQRANAGRLGPAGQNIQNQLLANTQSNAQGNLDPNTLQRIESNLAQQWGSSGFAPDTAAMSAAAERAMGLTSIGLESQAATEYGNLLAENPSAPIYSMGNLMVSPNLYASQGNQYANSANEYAQNLASRQDAAARQAYLDQRQAQADLAAQNDSLNYGTPATGGIPSTGRTGTGPTRITGGSPATGGRTPYDPYAGQSAGTRAAVTGAGNSLAGRPDSPNPPQDTLADQSLGGMDPFGTSSGTYGYNMYNPADPFGTYGYDYNAGMPDYGQAPQQPAGAPVLGGGNATTDWSSLVGWTPPTPTAPTDLNMTPVDGSVDNSWMDQEMSDAGFY